MFGSVANEQPWRQISLQVFLYFFLFLLAGEIRTQSCCVSNRRCIGRRPYPWGIRGAAFMPCWRQPERCELSMVYQWRDCHGGLHYRDGEYLTVSSCQSGENAIEKFSFPFYCMKIFSNEIKTGLSNGRNWSRKFNELRLTKPLFPFGTKIHPWMPSELKG